MLIESEMFTELNRLRTNPKSFLGSLEQRLQGFHGTAYFPSSGSNPQGTFEGSKAVKEAIYVVERQPSLPPLNWSQALAAAARKHCVKIGQEGLVAETASDGKSIWSRITEEGGGVFGAQADVY